MTNIPWNVLASSNNNTLCSGNPKIPNLNFQVSIVLIFQSIMMRKQQMVRTVWTTPRLLHVCPIPFTFN